MTYSLAQQANRAAKVYFQIAGVCDAATPEDGITAEVYREREEYLSDFHAFDIWTEGPEDWEDAEGKRPANPLNRERRKIFKDAGFEFKRDLTVLFKGVPCDEWVAQKTGN